MNKYVMLCWSVCRTITFFAIIILCVIGAYGQQGETEIIAHRGFWISLPEPTENSRAALQAALDAGFYGSETDVRITKDDVLVINHDAKFKGFQIEESTYAELKDLKLSNGETLPKLDDFLSILRDRTDSPTKLIIEIKGSNNDRDILAAEKILERVSSFEVGSRVEYLSFSYGVCKKIKDLSPESTVYYLSTVGREPEQLTSDGIFLGYECSVWNNYPFWIEEAHLLNLKTSVWTVDNSNQIYDFINKGIDYIITDIPDVATEIRDEINKTSGIECDDINYEDNITVRYYDLYGRQIKNPTKGQIILMINTAGKSKLVIY